MNGNFAYHTYSASQQIKTEPYCARKCLTSKFLLSSCRTYFVEYNFPVSEAAKARNGASSGAMATELMRVVSKKISSNGKEVSFGHRSVFPVQFDGQAVDRWWKQLLVFKVFSKTAGDKHVRYWIILASCES